MKWFWADLHLGQGDNLIKKLGRPATSATEWENNCVEAILKYVSKTDILYLLGDFAFRKPGYWRQQIKRQMFLIVGNHDPSITKIRNVFGGNFADYKVVKCCGVKTVLSHYPMAFWHLSHRGSYHLYGHIHNSSVREKVMDDMMPQRKSMDVSPESSLKLLNEFRPFNEEDVHKILGDRLGHDEVICSHREDYGRRKRRNMRDDASFEFWIHCKRCGEVLWDEQD